MLLFTERVGIPLFIEGGVFIFSALEQYCCFAKSKVSFCFTCPTPLLVKAMRQSLPTPYRHY